MTNSGMLMADGWMTIEWYNNNKYNSSIFPIKKQNLKKESKMINPRDTIKGSTQNIQTHTFI